MPLRHPANDTVSEIAAAKARLADAERQYPRDWEAVAAARANLRAAEERDYETMVSTRAWHERMRAEYAAAGNAFYVEENQAGIDRCDAALAALVPAREDRRAA